MLDSIISGLKDQVSGKLKAEAGVEENELGSIMDVVKGVTGKEVGKEMLGGNLSGVMSLFSKGSNNQAANGIQTSVTTGIVSGLIEKLGFSKDKATTVTNIVVPALLSLITKKNASTPDDDATPLKDLFGGSDLAGGIGKKIGGFFK